MRYAILHQPKPLALYCCSSNIYATRAEAESALLRHEKRGELTLPDGRVVSRAVHIIWKVGNIWRTLLGQDIIVIQLKGEPA